MPGHWSLEQRAAFAAAARARRLWESSTGPKTAAGKARCSKNSTKHGLHNREMAKLNAALAVFLVQAARDAEEQS